MQNNPWRGLPLNALRAFEAAARNESFARAASELNVTPAAVSQHVKLLEERVRLQLFKRLPQGIVLTDDGRLLLPTIQSSFGMISEALEKAKTRRATSLVTVSCVGVFARGWLIPALDAFRREHPTISLKALTHNNRALDLLPDADLHIRFGDGRWPDYESHELCTTPASALCAPHIASELSKPADILRYPLLGTYPDDECDFDVWTAWLRAAGVQEEPDPSVLFDSSALVMMAAMDGAGIGIAAPSLFQRDIEAGRLVQPFPALLEQPSSFFLTRKLETGSSAAADIVWNWLISRARSSHAL